MIDMGYMLIGFIQIFWIWRVICLGGIGVFLSPDFTQTLKKKLFVNCSQIVRKKHQFGEIWREIQKKGFKLNA
jgi:hypothetical protein